MADKKRESRWLSGLEEGGVTASQVVSFCPEDAGIFRVKKLVLDILKKTALETKRRGRAYFEF